METFLHSISSVAIILLLTMLGYLCSMLGWLDEHAKKFLSKYLITVAVPVMSAYGLSANITRAELLRAGRLLLAPMLATTLLFLLSYGAAKLLRFPRRRFGVFMMLCALSNMMFIGYPICVELFGERSIPYVMLNYFVNVCFIQLVGRTLVRWSGGHDDHSFKEALINIVTTPPVIGVLVGIALILFDIRLPGVISSTLHYINDTVTPLSLLLTGRVIHEIRLRRLRPDRDLAAMLGFRFLLSPALALAMCALFGVTGLPRSVFAVEFAMPCMGMSVAYSTEYGADEQFAAEGVALSTVACFVVIPVLMLLL